MSGKGSRQSVGKRQLVMVAIRDWKKTRGVTLVLMLPPYLAHIMPFSTYPPIGGPLTTVTTIPQREGQVDARHEAQAR